MYRYSEEQLEKGEKKAKATLEAEVETLKKSHAEELDSAKGEVEGKSVVGLYKANPVEHP